MSFTIKIQIDYIHKHWRTGYRTKAWKLRYLKQKSYMAILATGNDSHIIQLNYGQLMPVI